MNLFYVRIIGQCIIRFLSALGVISIFFIQSLYHCFIPPYYLSNTARQFVNIGFFSLLIIGIAGVFTGAAIVVQTGLNPTIIGPELIIPKIVVITIIKELGPVIIGLVMAGKIGSSIAAEIGTMRITEQIDALITLDVNPFKYLIAPRVLASIIAFPLFVICTDLIGIFGGCIVAVLEFNHDLGVYIKNTVEFFNVYDFIIGLVKSTVFGSIISIVSCYYGYHCTEGARGVGTATTSTVVLSSILIIFTNYILTLSLCTYPYQI